MKTLLGFVVLVLYTFSMLAWGHTDAARLCQRGIPLAHHAALPCLDQAPDRLASAPGIK